MPESCDYYRGAMRVLLDIAGSMSCPADHELIDEQISQYSVRLATLPPAEPAPLPGSNQVRKCPRCESPDPRMRPTVQFEGELRVCSHPFHMHRPLELPRGKPLTYEAPSPCSDCAAVWGLVDRLEETLGDMTNSLAGVGRPYKGNDQLPGDAGQFYKAYNAGIDSAHEFSTRLAKVALAKIAAARHKRGA